MTLLDQVSALPPGVRAQLAERAAANKRSHVWSPLVDMANPAKDTPQRMAFDSKADVVLYGGAAGGGKTDLLIGLAITQHRRSILFRREHKQLGAIVDRMTALLGGRDGYNGQEGVWRLPDRLVRLAGMQHLGDETAYQGQPYDLMGFDELAQFLEVQFRYVHAWNRSVDPKQRCRIVGASNPPGSDAGAGEVTTAAEAEWMITYWGPWLDPQHPYPAQPGELRWYITDAAGKDQAVADNTPQVVSWDTQLVIPRSRTFIPSSVDDNPYLIATGYKATLQGMPEPLRSQLLKGDFTAGRGDSPWQVIPSEWVRMAQARWSAQGKPPKAKMTAVGVDVARGGRDQTVLSPRYGHWFAEQLCYPGKDTPDGPITASLVVAAMRDRAQANIDAVGVGGEVLGHLRATGVRCVGIYSGAESTAYDKTGSIGFFNKRSEMWWKFREALDPASGEDIALPPSRELLADLCAPRWNLAGRGIKVESKEDTIKRLGRSPDKGDAAIYSFAAAPLPSPGDMRPRVGVV